MSDENTYHRKARPMPQPSSVWLPQIEDLKRGFARGKPSGHIRTMVPGPAQGAMARSARLRRSPPENSLPFFRTLFAQAKTQAKLRFWRCKRETCQKSGLYHYQ
ncbi:hypothetical protein [Scytonema sp. PCC 10023]|uniref:hypothetical protein n=1 Tax=Scytonema sp. PCC 10023 TaxID=1680591 RepID=UPI0039C6B879